jgi:hypothetical protein
MLMLHFVGCSSDVKRRCQHNSHRDGKDDPKACQRDSYIPLTSAISQHAKSFVVTHDTTLNSINITAGLKVK